MDMLRQLTLPLLVAASLTSVAALAQPIVTYTRPAAKVLEVRDDLKLAIEAKGFVVDYESQIGAMLERTGKDIGQTQAVYADARVLQFCSAQLSRKMMEADPANVVNCPYGIAVYATAAKPDEVVVAFRPLRPRGTSPASRAALREVNAMLDALAREAAGRK
jgi:uncharacterized protein (DUF302 family)